MFFWSPTWSIKNTWSFYFAVFSKLCSKALRAGATGIGEITYTKQVAFCPRDPIAKPATEYGWKWNLNTLVFLEVMKDTHLLIIYDDGFRRKVKFVRKVVWVETCGFRTRGFLFKVILTGIKFDIVLIVYSWETTMWYLLNAPNGFVQVLGELWRLQLESEFFLNLVIWYWTMFLLRMACSSV